MATISKSGLSLRTTAALQIALKKLRALFLLRTFSRTRREKMHLGDKIKEAGAIGYIFTLVTRDSDSNSAYYLFVARLHLAGAS